MTDNVHDIADYRSHLCVTATDGVHILPVELFRSVVSGEKSSSILTEPVVCRIIEEWLEKVTT